MARKVDPEKTPIAWDPESESYRIVEKSVETATVGGHEVSVEVDTFGDRVVWVDDAPDNIEDGSGHFEVFNGDDADYKPQVAAGAKGD